MRMKNKIRTFILTVVAVMMMTVPAFAGGDFYFFFTTEDDGESIGYTSNVTKTNDESHAVVNYAASSQYAGLYFKVIGQYGDDSAYTGTTYATAKQGMYEMPYTRDYYRDNNYRMEAGIYYVALVVEGQWEP